MNLEKEIDMKKIRRIFLFTAITMMGFIMLSCGGGNPSGKETEEHEEHGSEGVVMLNAQQRKALDLKLGSIQMRNLTTVVKVNGELAIAPESKADITTLIGGNVKAIKVFHGDKVRKGQVLATLEHPDYISIQESYAQVANNLEYLEQEYKRQKELYENNAGSGKSYQKAKADYFSAKAKYQGLRSRLQLLNLSPDKVKEGKISNVINLISPINGYVKEVNVKLGTFVGPQDKLFEIADNSAIHADFMVYEKDVHLLKMGQTIHFTVANRPEEEFTATIFAIGKEFEANTRAVHVHSQINEKTEGLVPGMYISGHLHTDKKMTSTLPDDAIVKEGTKSFIFVLLDKEELEKMMHEGEEHETEEEHAYDSDQWAFKMVEVITGAKDDGYTEVHLVDSLAEDAQIVLNKAYYLLADMKKEETEHEH